MKRLTLKQELWVEHYLQTRNATEAARRAGYSGGESTLRSVGCRNAANPNIQARIRKRLEELKMSADEVLLRLKDQAVPDFDKIAEAFEGASSIPQVLRRAQRLGISHLIKKIKQLKDGSVEVEFYDAQKALELIGRHHRLFVDRVEHTGSVDVEGTWTVEWGSPGPEAHA